MPQNELLLADARQAKDLATLVSRARAVDPEASVRLQARGRALALWVPVLAPETLLEGLPTVLGMRAVALARPAQADATVPAAAVLDRLARIVQTDRGRESVPDPGRSQNSGPHPETEPDDAPRDSGLAFDLPPVTTHPAWAGSLPGTGGWERRGALATRDLEGTAREGISAVENALPERPGPAVVSTVRSRIWGSTDELGVVAGAAFGADVLGFLAGGEDFEVFGRGPWRRLSNRFGHVLARPAPQL